MSYEQKYLKYKQKYQELKKMLGNGAHNLETEKYGEADFSLTDTPTNIEQPKQLGGAEVEQIENEKDFSLSETPTFADQLGGAPLVMADYTPSVPLTSCAGQVNPMPNVSVPLPASVATQNKNYVEGEELNTTTDLSEIQNTEDIAKLFGQFGGRQESDSSTTESTDTSDDSDLSDSDSF